MQNSLSVQEKPKKRHFHHDVQRSGKLLRWLSLHTLLLASLFWMGGCQKSECLSDAECAVGTYCKLIDGSCTSDCKQDGDCKVNQRCDTQRGRCKEQSKECLPHDRKGCVGDKLYWFDSCGNQEDEAEDCAGNGCTDGNCKTKKQHCGNGTCDVDLEDCLSCATDCSCPQGQTCKAGICEDVDKCGDGTCDKSSEDCQSCPKDCGCNTGEICQSGQCNKQASCGNGVCETSKNENCLSCLRDCPCKSGEACSSSSSSCVVACGDGKCDPLANENCLSCKKDCKCRSDQVCNQGRCEKTCGNGQCESPYGENCSTCAKDCPCGTGQVCKSGQCGSDCGNGTCDSSKGENCSTCAKDCACKSSESCISGKCQSRCGNRICESTKGENCSTCATDCACPTGLICRNAQCQSSCGDGQCESAKGENCTTCTKDCGCKAPSVCQNGKCSCQPQCTGKTCGDDGCGGSCGTCKGKTTCQSGKCECKHECKLGDATCLSDKQLERCEIGSEGCRYLNSITCFGRKCVNGSCCNSACAGKNCGPDGCGGTCGTCSARASCQSGKCVCKHECPKKGDKKCTGAKSYQECLEDAAGCRYWSTTRSCGAAACTNGRCCTPQCTGKECGPDGCGGTCGTCTQAACTTNLCPRKIVVISIYIPCGLCDDKGAIFGYAKPDPYVKITLGNNQTFSNKEKDNTCDKTITFNWAVSSTISPALLKNAKIEIMDDDPANNDDFCAGWSGDLSIVGRRVLVDKAHKNASFTIDVKR